MTSPISEETPALTDKPATLSSFKGVLKQYTLDIPSQVIKPVTKAARQSIQIPTPSKRKSSGVGPEVSSIKKPKLSSSTFSPLKKPKRSSGYAPPSKYAHLVNNLTDSIAPNLICLFIGLNPGIRTATSGHAYSHPSNLFWKLVHSSGCTPRLCRPAEDSDMPRLYGLGLTNIVSRPTKDGGELCKQEMDDSVVELEMKIALYKPEAVAIVGKSIWESIWRVKHGRAIRKEQFKYGWQDEGERMGKIDDGDQVWDGARVFVTTTTSGLAATMKKHEKEEIWKGLGKWVEQRREERHRQQGAELKGEAIDGEVTGNVVKKEALLEGLVVATS